jgi:hypothetical protein
MKLFANRVAATLLFALGWYEFNQVRLYWSAGPLGYKVVKVLIIAGCVWAGQHLWRQKGAIALALVLSALAVVGLAAGYYYLHTEHVIFSTVKDDLPIKAYCKYRKLAFGTYVKIGENPPIIVNEIPPSSDDLADCRARFPITDMHPDPTYSCLIISFHDNERPPLAIPLALDTGLDLPLQVKARRNLASRNNWSCESLILTQSAQ